MYLIHVGNFPTGFNIIKWVEYNEQLWKWNNILPGVSVEIINPDFI
jgi:hypothetical protein